jgi:hypothetical protein
VIKDSSTLQYLAERLDALYRRPKGRVFRDYAEEHALAELSRRPEVREELAELETFRERMPVKDRRFFPQSMHGLLTRWQEILDRARMYEPNPTEKSYNEKELDAFLKRETREMRKNP